jgi:hypothetical protein
MPSRQLNQKLEWDSSSSLSVRHPSSWHHFLFLQTAQFTKYSCPYYSSHTSPDAQPSGHDFLVVRYIRSVGTSFFSLPLRKSVPVSSGYLRASNTVERGLVTRAVRIVAVTYTTQPANHTATAPSPMHTVLVQDEPPAMNCGQIW